MCVHVCVYAHLCGGQRLTSGGFFSHSLLFETESLTSPGIHHFILHWLASEPLDPLHSALFPGLQMSLTFYMGSRNPNSVQQTLPTEPSTQLQRDGP